MMIIFWPHAHGNILLYPFKLAIESFSFPFGAPLSLLNGDFFLSKEYPKNYILVNLFYKMPEYIVLSFLISHLYFLNYLFFLKEKYMVFDKNYF